MRTRRSVPRCKMNGDHLRGRWLQNCNPALSMSLLRRRPDVYAYGRAMPAIAGKFDFRVCYRTSFWERERALQALSWTWRPYDCQMDPIDPDVFDSWLGNRTIVIVGDSLSAQLYYSLVFLLGRAIADAIEHVDGMRRAPTAPATPRHGVCASGVRMRGQVLSVRFGFHVEVASSKCWGTRAIFRSCSGLSAHLAALRAGGRLLCPQHWPSLPLC